MKHVSAAALIPADRLFTEDDVKAALRARLDGTLAGKAALAARLGVSESQLSILLRGGRIGEAIAERLGFRKVTRFERVN